MTSKRTDGATAAQVSIWFFVSYGGIHPVAVVRESGASIVIRKETLRVDGLDAEMRVTASESVVVEEKVRIKSSAGQYFRTWAEAHAHLLSEADERLARARRELQLAQSLHGNIKGMRPPIA